MTDREIVRKYFKGQASEDEGKAAMRAVATGRANKVLGQMIEEHWNSEEESTMSAEDSSNLFRDIQTIISEERKFGVTKVSSNSKRVWFKYAASIALIFAAGYFIFEYSSIIVPEEQEVTVAEIPQIVKSTSRGQKSTILLTDGSKIILNSQSSVRYHQFFSDTSRVVELVGEAFFEVSEDKNRPFIVVSHGVHTIALGTSFNVRSKDQEFTKVSLSTGKVMISREKLEKSQSSQEQAYFLSPGEALSINTVKDEVVKSQYDKAEDLLWKEGVLYFNDYTFDQISEKLEVWYDVKFTLKNGVDSNKRYTGRFDNVSLEHLLRNVGFTLGFDFFIQDKNVTIIFNDK